MGRVTFALAKGRLANKTLEILEKINVKPSSLLDDSRKLVFNSDDDKYTFFLAKPSDVPTYVDFGAADIGIVGLDTILEEGRDLYECLDLNIGKCKMCVAAYPEKKNVIMGNEWIKVATKYPNVARKYFESRNKKAEVIKLNGSVELGPLVGLSDCIVDIVESGRTLKENGLEIIDEICDLSARVIVNKVSIKTKYEEISKILKGMENINL
ncbi:MAG: ATP phosphoribosyltransferase [Lachnospiraceae bacterium]|nr:ATP phosphoribosyltransferase [Lachnospiraceae bacterium]